ncbi:hypothetical protein AB0I53_42650 [Saccharopolyspora sp. NPDC050389]|uniref:hypothetical protein n=1 Tax=Saccharopolyspora sp. NPDC050389 TaxID=3155516 RepID=UPI0033F6BD59
MTRNGQPWISVPKLEKLPEPRNLVALKAEVQRRWGTIDLLDILKDADFLTDFTDEFTSVATREALPRAVLRAPSTSGCETPPGAPAAPRPPSPQASSSPGPPRSRGEVPVWWRRRRARSGAGRRGPRDAAAGAP